LIHLGVHHTYLVYNTLVQLCKFFGCGGVVGRLFSLQYKSIFGAPDKVRRNMCEEARPSRLDFQRDEVKIHHIIASMQECWS
jgi:hypothetical protein